VTKGRTTAGEKDNEKIDRHYKHPYNDPAQDIRRPPVSESTGLANTRKQTAGNRHDCVENAHTFVSAVKRVKNLRWPNHQSYWNRREAKKKP
jgi:hypothetical protein